MAYAPFGETYASSGSPDLSFTGQNPDANANLYDFMYRDYGIQGRWPSPDPLGPGAFNLADPQSLDRYAYVRNNPTGLVHPLGLVNIPGYRSLVDDYAALGGGGGMSCTADGVDTPCSMVQDWVNSGVAGACNGSCEPTQVYGPSGFYRWNYSRDLRFVCNGESASDCSLTHDWLSLISTAAQLIFPLDLSGDVFVGTPEDQQIHSLASAVVAKAGYLTDWQFWAEAGLFSVGGAGLTGGVDAWLSWAGLDAAFPGLSYLETSTTISMQTGFPGGPAAFEEFLSGLATPSAPTSLAGASGYLLGYWLGDAFSH